MNREERGGRIDRLREVSREIDCNRIRIGFFLSPLERERRKRRKGRRGEMRRGKDQMKEIEE
jgi:hypothetical protein